MATVMASSSPLIAGLKNRLESESKLGEKLRLAVNVMKSRVLLPNKENIVIAWFSDLLSNKYSTQNWKVEELNNIWQSFLVCLRKVDVNSKSLVFKADFLINIVEHLNLQDETIEESVKILLKLAFKEPCDETIAITLISNLVRKDGCESLIVGILELLEKLLNFKSESFPEIGKLLYRLSLDPEVIQKETFKKIVKKLMLPKPEEYMAFFENLSSAESSKCTFTDSVNVFVDYLTEGGDISVVLSLLKSSSCPSWLLSKMFCLGLHLEGLPSSLVNPQSVVLAQLQINSTPSSASLARILNRSLPLDTNYQISENMKIGSFLTGLFKYTLEKYGLCEDTCSMLTSLYMHHPLVLEPVASSLLVKYLQNPDAPSVVVETVIGLALKLRQLPKMVSKLMLQMRTEHIEKGVAWKEDDLAMLGDSITQVPRVQSLEMWKMLLYHLTTDCISNLDTEQGSAVLRVAAPLLTTVLTYAQLADHNLPAPLANRVQDLAQQTANQAIEPLLKHSFEEHYCGLVWKLTSSLLELSELLIRYRGLDMSAVEGLREGVLKKIVKEKRLISSNTQLVLQALRTGSSEDAKIWKVFHQELIGNPEILRSLMNDIPPEYIQNIEMKEGLDEVVTESPLYAALVIYSEFSTLSNVQSISSVVRLDLWTNASNWYSLHSDLAVQIQNLLRNLIKSEDLVGKSGLLRLEQLPLESLPPVLRLAVTFLVVHQLYSNPPVDDQLNRILTRCFEDTDIFRYISAVGFVELILTLTFPTTEFITVLAAELGKYTKMLSELQEAFGLFQDQVIRGDTNATQLFVCLLERLAKSIGDAGVKQEKRAAAEALAVKISKALWKRSKKDDLLSPSVLLIRGSACMLKIFCNCGLGEKEGLGKLEKFVRKILTNALAEENTESLQLVNRILEVDDKDIQEIATPEVLDAARRIALGNLGSTEGSMFISNLLKTATVTDLAKIFEDCTDCRSLFQLTTILVSDANLPEQARPLLKPHLEKAVFALALEPDLELSSKHDLIEKLVCSTSSLVSGSVETTLLSLLLAEGLSSRTLQCFVSFLSTRPSLATRHIPLLCSAARQHLQFILLNPDAEQNMKICTQLQQLTSLAKRKKDDWANVAPYLLADILNTNISLDNPKLKQILTVSLYNLLDICGSHSPEYLAANLPTATNEMFKIVLENYKTNVKFTGH